MDVVTFLKDKPQKKITADDCQWHISNSRVNPPEISHWPADILKNILKLKHFQFTENPKQQDSHPFCNATTKPIDKVPRK